MLYSRNFYISAFLLAALLFSAACNDFMTKDHYFGSSPEDRISGDDDGDTGGGEVDSDDDGLSDSVEESFDGEARKADADHDGFGDGLEFSLSTGDPLNGNLSPSPLQRARILLPEDVVRNDPDGDGDGLGDGFETDNSLDPDSADTDGDGYSDAVELVANSDPFLSSDRPERDAPPASDGVVRTGTPPVDADGDGMSNDLEAINGTLTNSRDSDGDGFGDGVEFLMGSDPIDEFNIPNFNVPDAPTPTATATATATAEPTA